MSLLACLLATFDAARAVERRFTDLSGPYLGQEPPGLEPELFAPGVISTAESEGCAVFADDGRLLVFTRLTGDPPQRRSYFTQESGGRWSEPRPLPFAAGSPAADLTFSPDGKYLLFTSRQPLDGNAGRNVWSAEHTRDGWAEPVPFDAVINRGDVLYPSMTRGGDLYFMDWYWPPDEQRSSDIYVSRRVGGNYTKPEKLAEPVNSKHHDFDPFVAPGEDYLVFSSIRPGDMGNGDLYITFRDAHGAWGEAVHMGPTFNSAAGENRPFVTPDGKYFFFTSDKAADLAPGGQGDAHDLPGNGSRDVYWVDAAVLEQFRPGHE